VLAARGFSVDVVCERARDERASRHFFVGHKADVTST